MQQHERDRLAARPLAELHKSASELGIPRFRLLRKSELADAILDARTNRRLAVRAIVANR